MRSTFLLLAAGIAAGQTPVARYCVGCHSAKTKSGGVVLEGLDPARAGDKPQIWERVLRQMRSGAMPPVGLPRPDRTASETFVRNLESTLDRAAAIAPDPGAPAPHRLNRAEYGNAIRDLLALDVDAGAALPVDESGNGFDNMAGVLAMSPTLLERYLANARKLSRLAVGDPAAQAGEVQYGASSRALYREPDAEDLPLGARGGIVFKHWFPLTGDYEIAIRMLGGGEEGAATQQKIRLPLEAGPRTVVATFRAESTRAEVAAPVRRGFPFASPNERAPVDLDLRIDGASVKRFRIARRGGDPQVGTVTVTGPLGKSSRGDTPARQRIFVCKPATPAEEEPCAKRILGDLARRAFRRPVTESDVRPLLSFYTKERSRGVDFDLAIASGIEALLVSPDFLFRVEADPPASKPGAAYRLRDHDLASRLSFFLWSSIPDDELLNAKLSDPAARKAQVRRMLADPKSGALIRDFGGQWLFLRTLANAKPDTDAFSSFDENLRRSFQRETELFLTAIVRENRPVLDLLDADYTFVNERLARHYGMRGVQGPHFRRVAVTDGIRGGLLGQGSVLTVTSYPNRTSVVLRGKWVLENLLGTPPPPPPPDVPDLPAKGKDGRKLGMREAMELHRTNQICASCHARMDPIGFALENFNGAGEWRTEDAGAPIDAKGKLPGGAEFAGPPGLKKLLVDAHRAEFVETVASKLLTYALGRGLEAKDQPSVRQIARKAAADGYRMSAFVEAVVESTPFQMRRAGNR